MSHFSNSFEFYINYEKSLMIAFLEKEIFAGSLKFVMSICSMFSNRFLEDPPPPPPPHKRAHNSWSRSSSTDHS